MKTNQIWVLIEESFKEEEVTLFSKLNNYFLSLIEPMLNSPEKKIKDYLIEKYGIKKYERAEENSFAYDLLEEKNGIIKKEGFDTILNKMIQHQIDLNKWKLKMSVFSTMAGINIESCNKIEFRRGNKGFQGSWGFITVEGEKAIFETKAVFASGPIKCDHFRYLSHIVGKPNIKTDNRLRNEILKKLKEENPENKKKLTPEEKELKKRIEKAEAEIRNSKWDYKNCLTAIERNKKYLVDLAPEKLLGVEENKREEVYNNLKIQYTKDLSYNEKRLTSILEKTQKFEKELEGLKTLDLNEIKKELTLKADKKRIKEIKDTLSGFRLQNLSRNNPEEYQIELKNLNEELESLYKNHPEIKRK